VATFLVTYQGGGGPPPTPEAREQMMTAFAAWAGGVGDHMIDPGAPLGPSKTVTSDGVADGTAGAGVGGYTLLKADTIDEVVSLVQGHPFLSRGGTLVVSEAVAP
jgi:hypothetical protein